jgi:hypothetical protein
MHPDLAKMTKAQQLAHDVAAYKAMPQTKKEIAWRSLPQDLSDLEDDTDWTALYPDIKQPVD